MDTPVCSWMGPSPDGERLEPCGKPAQYYVEAAGRHRIYSCAEHIDDAREMAGREAMVHMVPGYRPESEPGEYTRIE